MKNGPYVLVVAPPDYPGKRYRGRYCYEHHLVWWEKTGEVPGPGWLVHHKNEVKTDNDYDNLEKKTRASHTSDHAKPPEVMDVTCFWCGKIFKILSRVFRSRAKEYGHTNFCCSRSCQVRKQISDKGSFRLTEQVNGAAC